MNIKIRYDELGEITVTNEQAFPKQREYQDNIEEVLALENIVEDLSKECDDYKNQASNLVKKRKLIKDKIKKHRKTRIIWYALLLIVPIITFIYFNVIGNSIHSIFDIMDSITFHEMLVFLGVEGLAFLGTLTFGHLYQDAKNNHLITELTEKINGYTIAFKAAKKLVEKKEKELENLKNDKSTLHKEEHINQVKEIDYRDDLLRLKKYLKSMYNYGTNDDYYQELIHSDDLFDKMYKKHEEEQGNTRKRALNLENEEERRKMNTSY